MPPETNKAATVAAILIFSGCAGPSHAGGSGAPTATPLQATSEAAKGANPWIGRSGEAEALADIAAGRPIKLFYQGIAGERVEMRTPGLSNCNPDRYDVPEEARKKFEWLDADFSESIQYTQEELARIRAAAQFARDYNVTMLAKKRADVLKMCPAATRD